jgi:hypothetical protein
MINYAILVGDEYDELNTLLNHLQIYSNIDNIKILIDTHKRSSKIDSLLTKYNIVPIYNPFKNFSDQRNFLLNQCDKDYIFWIDADETPSVPLLQNLPQILISNPSVDLIYIPRANYLVNDTGESIPSDIGPPAESDGRIGWPDFQGRIHKRLSSIKWSGELHEQLIGFTNPASLPANYSLSLVHIKKVSEQIKRKQFYMSIDPTK